MSIYRRNDGNDTDGGRSTATRQTNDTAQYPMSRADDSDVELSNTISGAKFRDPNARDQAPLDRRHKMWKKSRQLPKEAEQAPNYRERTYREGDEDPSSSDTNNEPTRSKSVNSAINTDVSEAESSDDSEGTRSVGDQRKISKAQRRFEKRQVKKDKKTRKLTKKTLHEVIEVKKETLASVNQAQRYVQGAEAAGHDTVQTLRKQNEQLGRINDELEGLDPLMEIAKRDIASIARRMSRDKCFIVLCLLVLGVLIVVIIVAVRHAGQDVIETITGSESDAPSPAPTTV